MIGCVSVNDAFVMDAWGKDLGVQDKIVMLADPQGKFVKELGLDFDASGKQQIAAFYVLKLRSIGIVCSPLIRRGMSSFIPLSVSRSWWPSLQALRFGSGGENVLPGR